LFAIEAIIRRVGEKQADTLTSSSSDREGATPDEFGNAQMNGNARNYPLTDPNGYWGVYNRVLPASSYTGQAPTSGKPEGAYKDAG
jgi:hypothetical protein